MPNKIISQDGQVLHYPKFFNQIESDDFLVALKNEVEWRNDKIRVFGKWHDQARKVAWHGDKGLAYTYSGIDMISPGWTKSLEKINRKLNTDFSLSLNSVLVNYYRHGHDYMSYHSDSEKELGTNPVIISVSFGVTRDFLFKHKISGEIIKLQLGHGDVLVMRGELQNHWKHALPKRTRIQESRLNLTYREIKQSF